MKLISAMIIALASTTAFAKPETYSVDTNQSKLVWEGKKKIGDAHVGELKFKSGSLQIEKGKIVSGLFSIDMTSMTNTDIGDESLRMKLLGHLKNDDFFSTDKYPTAELKVTKAVHGKGNKVTLSGDLTIKGKTAPIQFDAEWSEKSGLFTAKSEFAVDRTKYDIKYNSMKFFSNLGDKIINDEFTVKADLQAKK